MTTQEETQIRKFCDELSGEITIRFRPSQDRRSDDMGKFCENLTRIAPKIKVVLEKEETESLPAIVIGPGLRFVGIPGGSDLAPFLEALALLDPGHSSIGDFIKGPAQIIQLPVSIQVYVSPFCQFCPEVLRRLLPLPFASEYINLTVIDGTLFLDIAKNNEIKSVPTIILDKQFRLTGNVTLDELFDLIVKRDQAEPRTSTLERLLTEDGPSGLARMMLARGKTFYAFYDLLLQENFSTRLGAIVALEEMVEINPEIASEVIDPLWNSFAKAPNTVKGDILYVIGVLGPRKMLPALRQILEDEYDSDLKEAALDALEKIEGAANED